MSRLRGALKRAKQEFKPDIVVYNAGTDILEYDPLGSMMVTPEGVIERDAAVFKHALNMASPIVMLLSGGYTKHTHKVIANSILNLNKRFNLIPAS